MNEDQREAWRKALAASHRQQRNQRGGRKRGLATVTQAGMVRWSPRRAQDGGDGEDHD